MSCMRTCVYVVSCPDPSLSQAKGSGSWLCQVSSTDFKQALITCLHDIGLFHWFTCTFRRCGTISLTSPKSRLLTQHNQKIAQKLQDSFCHERVGSGHETSVYRLVDLFYACIEWCYMYM